jgi:hypothetical protein
VLEWVLLVGGQSIAGYGLPWPLIWILTSRSVGGERNRNGPLFRDQWIVATVIGAIVFVSIGSAVDWKL